MYYNLTSRLPESVEKHASWSADSVVKRKRCTPIIKKYIVDSKLMKVQEKLSALIFYFVSY